MAMNMDAMLRIKADVQGENNIRRLGNSMQGLQGQVKNAALGFNTLKTSVAGFATAIAGSAIIGGLSAVVKKSIDAGDELFNISQKSGVGVQALTGIGNAAKLADVDLAGLSKGLTKLNINIVKAAEGNEDLARKFAQLGVDVKDANGQVVPTEKVLKQLADRFADLPDGAQKTAAAVALFGKAGADLIPLLNEGAASMEKFTYKVSDDFAARSDLFNDTITEFGIKTQGFGLELTDALLPALQSILEVFGDLFDTKQDWTALFAVIEGFIRGLAVAIYTVVKGVDVLIKNVVAAVQAASQALSGDFGAAWQTITNRVTSGIAEQKQILADLNKLAFGSSSSPTGRTRSRGMELDTTDADQRAAADAKRAAAEARRAAIEQERLLERRATLTQQAISLQEELRNSVADVVAAYEGVGATKTDQLFLERNEAITENDRLIKKLTFDVVQLAREFNKAGGELDIKPFRDLIDQLSSKNVALADKEYLQNLKDLLPSLSDYDAKIKEVQQDKTKLTELDKLNAQINQLQLDILAATNPELAKYIDLLRKRAEALDEANKKSFGESFKDAIKGYVDSVKDLGSALGNIAVGALQNLEDKLFEFVTTGKLKFKEFIASILSDLAKLAIKLTIVNTIKALFPGAGFAQGGVFAQNGIVPFATGGIVDKPTLFKFANGTGLMGEAGPEAIIPLKRGRDGKLGVAGGGTGTVVNVSVDAKGTSVQGDSTQGAALGRVIAGAVQAELIKQKRPGGLLAA